MDDYISRKGTVEALCVMECGEDSYHCNKMTCEMFTTLLRLPAAPVREVKRGRWIGIDDEPHETWECDQCGYIQECIDGDQWNFCPNCGSYNGENGAELREDV